MAPIEIEAPGRRSESQTFWDLLRSSGCVFEADVKGSSMEPTLPDGARVRIRPVPAEEYRTGHVVACVASGELFAHRIVFCGLRGRSRDVVITQGDNLLLCDPPTRKSDILGLVSEYLAAGKWCPPGPFEASGRGRGAVARAHLELLRLCVSIHYEVGRRVGGSLLLVASFLRRARSMLRRG